MGESILEHRLKAVASRLHRLRILRRQTVCWLLVIIPAVTLCLVLPASGLPLRRESLSLIAACAVGLFLARWKLSVPTWLETARLVEQHNPGLNDVVLTAVRHRQDDPRVSTVLAARVQKEANDVAMVADWGSVASMRQIVKWFAASLATFAVLVSSVVAAGRILPLSASRSTQSADSSTALPSPTTLTVEPGDTEVERDTGLTVVARFSGPIPSQAAVVFRPELPSDTSVPEDQTKSTSVRTHTMTQTVDDGVFMVRLPAITTDGSYAVLYGDDDPQLANQSSSSEAYRITTFVRPRVEQVDAAITPPEWTGRKPSTIEDTLRIVAIEGSTVTLRLHLNKPVVESFLECDDRSGITLSVDADLPTSVQTTVTATEDVDWTVSLVDEHGRSASEETHIALRIIHNEAPTIRITFPQPDNSVSPLQEVLTEAEAVDDFGIVDYGITYSLSGGQPTTLSLMEENSSSASTAVTLTHTIDLEALKAAPNDLLTWHFYADTYAAAGQIQRTLSDLMFADVRRFEEVFRQGQQQSGQGQGSGTPSDGLLQIQRQIAIAIWNVQRSLTGSPLHDEKAATENVATIVESQELAREQLSRIKQSAPVDAEIYDAIEEADDYMLDVLDALMDWSAQTPEPALTDASAGAQGAFRHLLRLRAAEHQVQQAQQGQGSGQSSAQQNLDQLELDNDRNRYETQKQAQQDQPQEQREQLQILNRLKELARRQNMLNERLKQLESELRNTDDEEERQRIERELKRLRDEQQELLRDVDELRERMDQSPTRNDPQQRELREEVDQARENVRNASRAIDDGKLSEALSAGTRAERQFDQLQKELRNKTSSAFEQAARDLRRQARDLSERQENIGRQLDDASDETPQDPSPNGLRSLRDEQLHQNIPQKLGQQRDELKRILEQSQELVQQAEESEPLLARELFEAVQQTEEMRTEDALRAAEFLAGRGLWEQVKDPEQAAQRGIDRLREGIEKAAEAVLGSEAESLRRAQQTLEQLSDELSEEVEASTGQQSTTDENQQTPSGQRNSSSARSSPQSPNEQQSADSPSGQRSQSGDQPSNDSSASPSEQQPGSSSSPSDSSQPGQNPTSFLQRGGGDGGGTASTTHRPLTGGDFLNWSDRLRDVEEMLDDQELRQRVARVRDRARSMRAEFKRHGKEPQWDLVESGLLDEMQSLQRRLLQDIAALQSDRSLVPIDREPVPEEFDELVQRYYELLGQDRQEEAP